MSGVSWNAQFSNSLRELYRSDVVVSSPSTLDKKNHQMDACYCRRVHDLVTGSLRTVIGSDLNLQYLLNSESSLLVPCWNARWSQVKTQVTTVACNQFQAHCHDLGVTKVDSVTFSWSQPLGIAITNRKKNLDEGQLWPAKSAETVSFMGYDSVWPSPFTWICNPQFWQHAINQ